MAEQGPTNISSSRCLWYGEGGTCDRRALISDAPFPLNNQSEPVPKGATPGPNKNDTCDIPPAQQSRRTCNGYTSAKK